MVVRADGKHSIWQLYQSPQLRLSRSWSALGRQILGSTAPLAEDKQAYLSGAREMLKRA
jgi:hypothetical protein